MYSTAQKVACPILQLFHIMPIILHLQCCIIVTSFSPSVCTTTYRWAEHCSHLWWVASSIIQKAVKVTWKPKFSADWEQLLALHNTGEAQNTHTHAHTNTRTHTHTHSSPHLRHFATLLKLWELSFLNCIFFSLLLPFQQYFHFCMTC